MADFDTTVKNYVEGLQKKINEHFSEHYKNLTAPVIQVTSGKNYIKLIKADADGTARSVHSFIARIDNYTKGMGSVKQGDILMAASFKAPAKWARGNIFEDDALESVDSYGVHGAIRK